MFFFLDIANAGWPPALLLWENGLGWMLAHAMTYGLETTGTGKIPCFPEIALDRFRGGQYLTVSYPKISLSTVVETPSVATGQISSS